MLTLSVDERAAAGRARRRSASSCGARARSAPASSRRRCRSPGRSPTSSGWVSWEVTGIFENIGIVQEGMETIAVPHTLVDQARRARARGAARRDPHRAPHLHLRPRRRPARARRPRISSSRPGERVGLVGRSGAGKSTLVNLLLRFHEVEQGSIRIDGQDIGHATQESLRAAIGMVTQDTSLLHRSIAANIAYGRPGATPAEIEAAARQAQAHEFIARPGRLEGAHRLRRARRRARRQAFGRPAPAHRPRARDPEGRCRS